MFVKHTRIICRSFFFNYFRNLSGPRSLGIFYTHARYFPLQLRQQLTDPRASGLLGLMLPPGSDFFALGIPFGHSKPRCE